MGKKNMYSLLQRICYLLFLILCFQIQLTAQCDPPELLPTVMCGQAPEVCLQNACYSTQPVPAIGFTGFCGPMTIINNPQFFAFTPIDTLAIIEILVTECNGTGNNALQSAIIPGCDWDIDSVLVCDAGTGVNGTMSLTYDQFVPFNTYYLIIDGSNGAVCEYEITNSVNIFEPGITETIDDLTPMTTTVCQGQDVLTAQADPPITNAAQYSWSLPWGEEVTSSNSLNVSVPDDAPLGTFSVCVFGFSGCDTMDMPFPCFDLTIVAVDDVNKDPATFCEEEIPFIWHGTVINGPGNYNVTFDNPEGCPYDSVWIVDVYPSVPTGAIDTVHCGLTIDYESNTYDSDGSYLLEYPGQGLNGCDSAAMFNVTLVDLNGFIDYACESSTFIIEPVQLIYQPSNANFIYQWYESGELIVGEDLDQLIVLEGGVYSLVITLEVNGVTCDFDVGEIAIDVAQIVPVAPVLAHGDTTICPGTNIFFEVPNPDSEVTGYLWYGPSNVFFNLDDSPTVTMDFTDADPVSEICVSAYNDCGEGERTCFNVNLIQVPEVSMDVPSYVCQDSFAIISFTGIVSSVAEFVWDFDGGNIITGMGEGPYVIEWPTGGQKEITVQVAEIGCDTVSATEIIDIESISPPVLNCISTISSITFSWNNVPGAVQYDVEIEGQAPFMSTDTFFMMNGLNPGDSLTISVFSIGQNECASSISVFGCSAQNCPPPTIVLSGADTICLNQNLGQYSLYAVVNGDTTGGSWIGPGIADPSTGVFDPFDPGAGPGNHAITFRYTDQNNCTSQSVLNIVVIDSLIAAFEIDSVICQLDFAVTQFIGSATAGSNYQWTFDNATILSGSNEGPYQLEWNTPGIKQINLSIENNGCVSNPYSQEVEVKPTLQHPLISCSPNTSSVEFGWDAVPNSTGFQVNLLQGTAGVQSGNQILFNNLSPGDTIVIELITLSDGICPELRDTAMCVARECPPVTVSIDSIVPICLVGGLSPIDLSVDVQNGNGTGEWSGPGIIDSFTGRFDPYASDAGVGSHQVVYTYQDDGCTFVDNINIVVNEVPQAIISNSVLQLTCENGNELILDGSNSSPSVVLNYMWTTSNGLIISGGDTSQSLIGAAGLYQLLVETMQGCVDSVIVEVTQDANAPVADAGEDQRLDCSQTIVQLGGNSSEGPDISYLWSTNDGSITSDMTSSTITADSPGIYELEVRNTSNGCVSIDAVTVTENYNAPVVSASVTEVLDCDTESVEIQGEADGGGDVLNIEWSTVEGTIESGGNTTTPLVSAPGSYTMVVTNLDNGCVDSVSVIVLADDGIITGIEYSIMPIPCLDDGNVGSVSITSIAGGQAPFTYLWNDGQTDSSIENLDAGEYFVIILDSNGCSFDTSFIILQPEEFLVDAQIVSDIENPSFFEGDSVTISLSMISNVDAVESIIWSGTNIDGLCMNSTECHFQIYANTTVDVLVIDTNGCEARSMVDIEVVIPRVFFIPNVFTPNGDNQNDFFTVFGRENIINLAYLRIYDRWGETVFGAENIPPNIPELGWNGKLNNEDLLPGVYVYTIMIQYADGVEQLVRGDLTLLR
jgi:gliding motility-associated-like protein